ncbi:hypothetical protein E4413_16425 [Leptospira interrogans]|nr:hypothetical protein C5473_14555 [Leptospira interrogans serovar Weerasinghe]KAA1291101.1 hypothetical protein C4X99_12590 [Leptospira interrogans serovar Geyaweera]QCO39123.1 hypothetical protein E4412_16340 [Leptospira interrogans]QCO42889.1 hypothetical protein E4413_16425 [Leptospira interrogans]
MVICGNSYIILQKNLRFVIVPTFKESICKIQIPVFSRTMSSLHRTKIFNAKGIDARSSYWYFIKIESGSEISQ